LKPPYLADAAQNKIDGSRLIARTEINWHLQAQFAQFCPRWLQMIRFILLCCLVWGVLLVSGCDEGRPTTKGDRGTVRLVAAGDAEMPTGVVADNLGRWSLASAPALTPGTLSAKSEMRGVSTEGHLHIFHERLPGAAELERMRSDLIVTDLALRTFSGRLSIDRGCLKLNIAGRPLVRFTGPPLVQRDGAGYLVLGGHDAEGKADYSRLGEEVVWLHGPFRRTPQGDKPALVTDPTALAPIRAACGAGQVIQLPNRLESASLLRNAQYESEVKQFQEMYGVQEAEARRKLAYCRTSQACGALPPPPLVADPKLCPEGTAWQSGLCRNEQGYVRPVP
jgi:hypothetical protein